MNPLEYTRDYQKRIPFLQHLKIQTDALGKGTAQLSLPIEKAFTNSLGTAHGGVIMSLLDVALCTAAIALAVFRGARRRGPRGGGPGCTRCRSCPCRCGR